MGAARYIGRIGGLALGLGAGAALYGGIGIAAADSPDAAPSGTESQSAQAPASQRSSAGPRANRGAARAVAPAAAKAARAAGRSRGEAAAAARSESGSDPASRVSRAAAAEPDATTVSASVPPETPVARQTVSSSSLPADCSRNSNFCSLIAGPSGVPIPTSVYANTALDWYIRPNAPLDGDAQVLFTPEGAYPVVGIKVLPLPISVDQGLEIVEAALEQLQPLAGRQFPITIFGYSQSAVISSILQRDLQDPSFLPGVNRDLLSFVTVGQEMNPNGGWFARFPGFNTPSLGEFFYGSTGYDLPTATGDPDFAFPVTNYTLQYDGFADSPRYPLNFLSALNAALGILLVHGNYTYKPSFAATYGDDPIAVDGPGKACAEGTSQYCSSLPVLDSPEQRYYFIQTPNLPLLVPLRQLPVLGNALADLIQPALKVIVDLGYADPAHGFTSATQPYANVALPFGVFPDVNPLEVVQKLVDGVVQGVGDFLASFGPGGSVSRELSAIWQGLTSPAPSPTPPPVSTTEPSDFISAVQQVITDTATWLSAGLSAAYATLLATADFVNAALLSVPAYALNLFIDGIREAAAGDVINGLINAVGRPIAFVVGMSATIIVVQATVWLEALVAIITGCGPAAPTSPEFIPGLKLSQVCR